MSNEEKILSLLNRIQRDFDKVKTLLKNDTHTEKDIPQTKPKKSRLEGFEAMSQLLDDEERDALGRYQRMEQARKDAFFEHDTWILPANPKNYDVDAAFRKLRVVEWTQTRSLKNIKLGDFVYIYESSPIKAIRWKCRVGIVNVKTSEIDDSCFWRTRKVNTGSFIWLESLREYNVGNAFSYEELCKNGLKSTVRSPMKVTGQLLNYLETIDEMAEKNERNKK